MTSVRNALARETFAKVARTAGHMAGGAGRSERSRGNGIQFNGIPAGGLTVAAVVLPDGIVLGR
jgi:hypothetical protein